MAQQESSIVHADATRVDSGGKPEKGGEVELKRSCKEKKNITLLYVQGGQCQGDRNKWRCT